jgi:hypothetical protein
MLVPELSVRQSDMAGLSRVLTSLGETSRRPRRTLLLALALFSVFYFAGYWYLLTGLGLVPKQSFEWEYAYVPLSKSFQRIVIHAEGNFLSGEPELVEECRLSVSLTDNHDYVHFMNNIYRPYDVEHQPNGLLGSYFGPATIENWLASVGIDNSLPKFDEEARELCSILGSAVVGCGTSPESLMHFTGEQVAQRTIE